MNKFCESNVFFSCQETIYVHVQDEKKMIDCDVKDEGKWRRQSFFTLSGKRDNKAWNFFEKVSPLWKVRTCVRYNWETNFYHVLSKIKEKKRMKNVVSRHCQNKEKISLHLIFFFLYCTEAKKNKHTVSRYQKKARLCLLIKAM